MALKRKINKAAFEALDPILQAEYKQDGANYLLDTGDDAEIIRAKDHEAARRREAEQALTAANSELADLREQIAKAPKADAFAAAVAKAEKADKYRERAVSTKKDATALALAQKISTSPKLLLPHISDSIHADFDDAGELVLQMKDSAGKLIPYDETILTKKFVDDTEFKGILIANRGSGSGGDDKKQGGGAPGGSDDKPKNVLNMPPAELAQRLREKRAASEAAK